MRKFCLIHLKKSSFCPYNKMRLRGLNSKQSGKIEISSVEDIDASSLVADLIHKMNNLQNFNLSLTAH